MRTVPYFRGPIQRHAFKCLLVYRAVYPSWSCGHVSQPWWVPVSWLPPQPLVQCNQLPVGKCIIFYVIVPYSYFFSNECVYINRIIIAVIYTMTVNYKTDYISRITFHGDKTMCVGCLIKPLRWQEKTYHDSRQQTHAFATVRVWNHVSIANGKESYRD